MSNKNNIAYVCTCEIPSKSAYSVHVMKMCNALSKNGNRVYLVTPLYKKDKIEDSVYDYYGVDKNFEIVQGAWPPVKGKSLVLAFDLIRIIKKLNINLVFSRFIHGATAASLAGFDTIFESHRPIWRLGKTADLSFDVLKESSNLSELVFISGELKRMYIKEKNISEDMCMVSHDASDDNIDHKPVDLVGTKNNKYHIGYVGSLYEGKGVDTVLNVAKELKNKTFHIVGGGKKEIDRWEDQSIPDNLVLHGYKRNSVVPRYIEAFDICLLPNKRSVSIYGGGGDIGKFTSPLKMFEYMSQGKPIIASDLPVLREVLEDGSNAILCDPEDTKQWVNAIKGLCSKESLRDKISSKARKDFVKSHTWKKRAEDIVNNVTR